MKYLIVQYKLDLLNIQCLMVNYWRMYTQIIYHMKHTLNRKHKQYDEEDINVLSASFNFL